MSLNRRLRVLIADDIQETRRNTRLMLSLIDGVEVVAIAANGLQAVEMAKQHLPDIVILDINMPELDGLSAYKQISQSNPNTACIIISAEKNPNTFRTAMSIGIQNYLIKPFTADELEEAVKQASEHLEKVSANRVQTDKLRLRSDAYLKQLAEEFSKARRTDDQAMEVFEELIESPDCELRWMQTLAIIYVIRQNWGKLKTLAEKIEQRTK